MAYGEMLLRGTTTVCDFFYLNGGDNERASASIEAARRLGIRMVLARCFYDWDGAPALFREDRSSARRNFLELHRHYHERDRYRVSVHPAPHSQHGATPESIREGAACAAELEVPWHIHLAEERYQVEESLRRFGQRPLHAVAELGVLDDRAIVVHGCWFDASERERLAQSGAGLAYNPASNMFLGDGITDVVDLRARGARVGLGTDGGCSNSRVSIYDEMRQTALLQKVARVDGQAITAEDCWAMGTKLGAELLDLPTGLLQPGYRADLVAVDLSDLSLWPLPGLAKQLVYSMESRAVRDVVVDGEDAVVDGALVSMELAEIHEGVRKTIQPWEDRGVWSR